MTHQAAEPVSPAVTIVGNAAGCKGARNCPVVQTNKAAEVVISGARRLVNQFEIDSRAGAGTRVSIARWK